eukprot:SAG11_NODE_9129_length_940_cov_0.884661_2_plen_114_part_00
MEHALKRQSLCLSADWDEDFQEGGGPEACAAECAACEADEACAPIIADLADVDTAACFENELCNAGMLCSLIADSGEECGSMQHECMADADCQGMMIAGPDDILEMWRTISKP